MIYTVAKDKKAFKLRKKKNENHYGGVLIEEPGVMCSACGLSDYTGFSHKCIGEFHDC